MGEPLKRITCPNGGACIGGGCKGMRCKRDTAPERVHLMAEEKVTPWERRRVAVCVFESELATIRSSAMHDDDACDAYESAYAKHRAAVDAKDARRG